MTKIIKIYYATPSVESKARDKMTDEHFKEYVDKHGYHFTKCLAKHVSSLMKPSDEMSKPWTPEQVQEALQNVAIPNNWTIGDATYVMNMAKMDFYPKVLKSDIDVIKYTEAYMNDPDGYEGQPFCRWLSDDLFKDMVDDWEMFV